MHSDTLHSAMCAMAHERVHTHAAGISEIPAKESTSSARMSECSASPYLSTWLSIQSAQALHEIVQPKSSHADRNELKNKVAVASAAGLVARPIRSHYRHRVGHRTVGSKSTSHGKRQDQQQEIKLGTLRPYHFPLTFTSARRWLAQRRTSTCTCNSLLQPNPQDVGEKCWLKEGALCAQWRYSTTYVGAESRQPLPSSAVTPPAVLCKASNMADFVAAFVAKMAVFA